jgi:hypothetical protein
MATLIAKEITSSILSAVNREMYEIDTETDGDLFAERARAVETALNMSVTIDDAWEMALGLADLWMPTPSRTPFAYNSVEYNTVEIFCLCIKKAFDRRYL